LAFYGRTSTAEFPDPVTSRAWQREMAEAVIADRGVVVVDFFELGCSQRVPWERRSEAVALLEQARLADRRFNAVIEGEFGRAFTDRHDPSETSVAAGRLEPAVGGGELGQPPLYRTSDLESAMRAGPAAGGPRSRVKRYPTPCPTSRW
jgi:hypothetical protein